MKVKLFHKSGIPAGTFEAKKETKTSITITVNGVDKKFSKNTKRQLGSPKFTLVYREV